MVLKIFEVTKDFPREYKYTLGRDMKRDGIELVRSGGVCQLAERGVRPDEGLHDKRNQRNGKLERKRVQAAHGGRMGVCCPWRQCL